MTIQSKSRFVKGMFVAACVGVIGLAFGSLAAGAAPGRAIYRPADALAFDPFNPRAKPTAVVSAPAISAAALLPPPPVRVPYRPALRSPSRP